MTSKSISKKPYKGTRDFFPEDQRVQNFLFEKMHASAKAFGYAPINGPMLEETELYRAKSGQELINEQVYNFIDRGERDVTIRPEMTPTVARMLAQVHRQTPMPIRWYSIPNLYRYERPQKGRLREHWQLNVDIFGSDPIKGTREILQVGIHLLTSFGATEKHFKVKLNDRVFIDLLFQKLMKLDEAKSYQVIKLIDRYQKMTQEKFQAALSELDLPEAATEVLQNYLALKDFTQWEEFCQSYKLDYSTLEFTKELRDAGIEKFCEFDPSVVRGLDYYTGHVFEFFDLNPDNRRALCGGGAYADLLKIFNEPSVHGVGLGLGDVTLFEFVKGHNLLPESLSYETCDAYVFATEGDLQANATQACALLRGFGLEVVESLTELKVNKGLKSAQRHGAKHTVLFKRDNEQIVFEVLNKASKTSQIFPNSELAQSLQELAHLCNKDK